MLAILVLEELRNQLVGRYRGRWDPVWLNPIESVYCSTDGIMLTRVLFCSEPEILYCWKKESFANIFEYEPLTSLWKVF